jgi:hypothetical protein
MSPSGNRAQQVLRSEVLGSAFQCFGRWSLASGYWLGASDQLIESQLPAASDQQRITFERRAFESFAFEL